MGSNTQAKSKEVIVLLTNFIFISLTSFYLSFVVLAFFGFPPWEVISGCSLRYSAGSGGSLRGKFGFAQGKLGRALLLLIRVIRAIRGGTLLGQEGCFIQKLV
jgi:hypothetical protein